MSAMVNNAFIAVTTIGKTVHNTSYWMIRFFYFCDCW